VTKAAKRNEQKTLDRAGVVTLQLLEVKRENVQLRQRVLELETRTFGLEVDRDYGNPDERVQLDSKGTITRVPRTPKTK
jgi:hypothetical protein